MLQFVREVPIRIVLQGTLSSRRGFLFHVAAGFSKAVDPLSGMTVDLTLVDQWLAEARQLFADSALNSESETMNATLVSWVQAIRVFLGQRARTEGARLASLRFCEERGWSISWDESLPEGRMIFSYPHYVESLPDNGDFDLLKIYFSWLREPACQDDYQHEGFKLLKALNASEARSLQGQLSQHVGLSLEAGSTLQAIRLEYLGENYTVEFAVPKK